MRGKYNVIVKNNVLRYQFEIRRNITIIQGNSATGKTTLIDMIREYYENGEQSGVELHCDTTCAVLEGRQWKTILDTLHNSIVFIDEGNLFVSSNEFADAVKLSDNYFVIVTRESLPNLPYSVDEIYGIKSSGKYGMLKQTYQEFYHIYRKEDSNVYFEPTVLLVEDSNAGYEFFSEVSKRKSWTTVSAGGKSNIFRMLKEYEGKQIMIIADGAAFGSEMHRVMKKIQSVDGIVIYLPESFEWLILKSDILKDKDVDEILENPSGFIESQEYMSWERFFTDLLVRKTKDTYLKYSKSKLNSAYKSEKIQEKIRDVIPQNLI